MTTDSTPEPRFPTLTTWAAAAAIFGLVQGIFTMLHHQSADPLRALLLGKAGLLIGVLTVTLILPLVLLTRRFHPAARRGDRPLATRSLLFGLTAAVAAWMITDLWVSGPLVPGALEGWFEVAAALAAGLFVARRPPGVRATRVWAILLSVVLILAFLPMSNPNAAAGDEGSTADVARTAAAGDLPDVVLICIDTLRSDRLGAYGRSPSITPEMDRFAEEGFVFERALSASPWTVPSVAAIMTGLPTARHGAGLPLRSGPTFVRSPLKSEVTTLAERYAAAGYRTRAVVSNAFLSPGMGMARGFDEYETPMNDAVGSIFMADMPLARLLLFFFPPTEWADFGARGITDRALRWLNEEDDAPLFLWAHYIDPHTPFQADPTTVDLAAWADEINQVQPEALEDGTVVGEVFAGTSNIRGGSLWIGPEDRRRIEEYYDRAVGFADGELGRLFAALRQRADERRVVAVLTSDHGEEFWEHGHFEHGHDYYSEVTRVPLVFWGPGEVPAGRAAAGPVGLVDVAPTLLELSGLRVPAAEMIGDGQSLVSLMSATGEPVGGARVRFAGGNLYGLPAVLLEDDSWRVILRANGAVELYDVEDDAAERYNRALDYPEMVEHYRTILEPRLATFLENRGKDAPELDAETLKALESLGYVQ
jgi:arylsulfatase A-like enzyme